MTRNNITIIWAIWILFFTSGCSDWVEMPEIKNIVSNEKEDNTPPWVPYKVNIEVPVSCITIFDDGKQFIGTNDGNIYRSENNGKSWEKVGILKYSVPVTCFLRYPYVDGYVERILYFAGTERGAYKSEDNGNTWQESLRAEGVNGEWTKINYGRVYYSSYDKVYHLYLSGYDGEHNEFTYNPLKKDWGSVIPGIFGFDYEDVDYDFLDDLSVGINFIVKYKQNYSRIIFNSGNGITNSCFIDVKANSVKIFKKTNKKGSLGAIDGFYSTTDAGKSWNKRSLFDTIVYSLAVSVENYLFAGTEKGLFFSSNEGKTWNKLPVSLIDEPIIKLYSYKDYIYAITGNGEVYYFRVPKNTVRISMPPVLISPENKSVVKSPVQLRWYGWIDDEKGNYNLQVSGSHDFSKEIIYDTLIYTRYHEINGLINGKEYFWRVRTIALSGISIWSDIYGFTVK